jgi:penicillin-binding protein-related factor A (putative recombinase)
VAVNRGKDFEGIVKDCFKAIPNVYIRRLYDPQGGQLGVANPCDFDVYKYPKFYMIECKSVHGNTLSIHSNNPKKKYGNISNTQWEGLSEASKYGVVCGVLCWWVDKDITRFLPIESLVQRKIEGNKSIRYDDDLPNSLIIKGSKKRVFFDYDFTEFLERY